MTPEQIQILNDSIMNIHLLCLAHNCNDCPMSENCKGYPNMWETIKEGDD